MKSMKIVLAPDKFKGALSSLEFCRIFKKGFSEVWPEANIISKPMADGGDGTLEVINHYLHAKRRSLQVNDPLFRPLEGHYSINPSTKIAYIEMAIASGLECLHPEERNCMLTTTLGTGELIRDAIHQGAKHIILGIGGSATNDAGMGMAQALGYRFLDRQGKELAPIGKNLVRVYSIQSPEEKIWRRVRLEVACDVENPLFGPQGAAYVYGPQKGANSTEIAHLDQGLQNFANLIENTAGIDVQQLPGAGAAGGLGAGLVGFIGAELVSGFSVIAARADLEESCAEANWIVTGEGQLDSQTLSGKTIAGVWAIAQKHQIPLAAFCGRMELAAGELPFAYSQAITPPGIPSTVALEKAPHYLEQEAHKFAIKLKQESIY